MARASGSVLRRAGIGSGLLVILLLAAWALLLRPASLGGTTSYVIVSGRSMEPTMHTGDLAVVRRTGSYGPGDIVAFRTESGLVIHRVVGGDEHGYELKGDNNSWMDQWHPAERDVLGERVILVPRAGTLLRTLASPRHFALVAGVAGGLAAFGGSSLSAKRRAARRGGGRPSARRTKPALLSRALARSGSAAVRGRPRRARREDATARRGRQRSPSGDTSVRPLVGFLLVLPAALAASLLAFSSFSRPTMLVDEQRNIRYSHTVRFEYVGHSDPSTLDPDGVLGPVRAPDEPPPPPTGVQSPGAAPVPEAGGPEPMFVPLARSLDLSVLYELSLPGGAGTPVEGEFRAGVTLSAEGGWRKGLAGVATTPFTGTAARFDVHLDLRRINRLAQVIGEETRFAPGRFTVTVTPTVTVRSGEGAERVEESFAPPFVLTFDGSTITPDAALYREQSGEDLVHPTRPNDYSVLGASIPVLAVRTVALSAALLLLALAAWLCAHLLLGIGAPEPERIRARYGSLLVKVDDPGEDPNPVVALAGIEDLARLAERDGGIVFHEGAESGPRYFVRHATVTYEYRPSRQRRS